MPVLVLVLALAMVVFDTVHEAEDAKHRATVGTEARSLGADMLIIRNALHAYSKANPAVFGEVAVNHLGLPSWFQPQSGIRNHIEGGRVFVYYTPLDSHSKPDVASALSAAPTELTGVADGSKLISPRSVSNISLPPTIPTDSLVLMY